MKVKFIPQNVEFEIRPGQSVLHLAHEHDIHIQSVCKGLPSCAECRVKVVEGDHNVVPPNDKELSLIGTAQFVDQSRLSCQLRCFGDITVDLTEQVEKAERVVKRPRGKVNRFGDDEDEGQRSRAVMGNLILSEFDVDSMVDEESSDGVETEKKPKLVADSPSRPSFYGNFIRDEDKGRQGESRQGHRRNNGDSPAREGGQDRSRRRRNRPKKHSGSRNHRGNGA